MEEKGWVKPITIGVLIGVLTTIIAFFVIPPLQRWWQPENRLTYSVSPPRTLLTQPEGTNLVVNVLQNTNQVTVKELYSYKISLENSGTKPLTDIPVDIYFTTNANFHCLATVHKPNPARLFGGFDERPSPFGSKRFKYSLINPGHKDEINFVVNVPCEIEVVAVAQGLVVKHAAAKDGSAESRYNIPRSVAISFATLVIGSLLSSFYLNLSSKRYEKLFAGEMKLTRHELTVLEHLVKAKASAEITKSLKKE